MADMWYFFVAIVNNFMLLLLLADVVYYELICYKHLWQHQRHQHHNTPTADISTTSGFNEICLDVMWHFFHIFMIL